MNSVTLKTETVGLEFLNTNDTAIQKKINNRLEDVKSYDYFQNMKRNARIKRNSSIMTQYVLDNMRE